MATLTATPIDVLASPPTTPKVEKRRIRFNEDPVSDVFIVNRIAENLILAMFYQPEDFARFRYEREMERFEENQGRNRFPQRCSMDLTKNNLSVPLAPRRQPTPSQAKIQRPKVIRTVHGDAPISPMRSLSPMRPGMVVRSGSGGRRTLSPMRPCSRGGGRNGGGPAGKGKRPMALAA